MAQESARQIEQEIAELSRAIEAKRTLLEKEEGIVEEKELVRQAVQEVVVENLPQVAPLPPAKPITPPPGGSYLDNLDEESRGKIQALITETFNRGIKKTIPKLQYEEPFIIDAYHDALVDKLYDELKKRGIVK